MRTYELVFIAQPELDDEALAALNERVRQNIVNNGGEVLNIEIMGKRRLAFAINRKREGTYVLVLAKMENPVIVELERSLKLWDEVLRHLLVRIEELPEPEIALA
ncbi:MAG: 30S ribosomal protein S6 [Chloroflexota bacterium]